MNKVSSAIMKYLLYFRKQPVFIAFLIIAFYRSYIEGKTGGDFDVFIHAGRRLLAGEDIYSAPHFRNLQYYYSPFFAMILAPLTYISDSTVKTLWLILNSVFIVRIWKLASDYFDVKSLPNKNYHLWMAISIVVLTMPIQLNFQAIQMTIFIAWSILESVQLFKRNKIPLGASLLAIAINIKTLPLILIPYLLYHRMYKAILYVFLFIGVFLLIPYLILGNEYANLLNSTWWKTINPTNHEHLVERVRGFYSISAIIPTYFADYEEGHTTRILMYPINIMSLSNYQVKWVVNSVRALLFLSSLIPLKSALDKKFKGFISLSYLCLLIPLIFPHQRGYSFFMIAPMTIFLTYYFLQNRTRIRNKKISFFLFVISIVLISPIWGHLVIGDHLLKVYRAYKIIPLATLLLIPVVLNIVIRDGRSESKTTTSSTV